MNNKSPPVLKETKNKMYIVLIVIIQVLLRFDRRSALCSSATFQPAEGDLHLQQQVDLDHFTTDRLVAPKLQP